jgi:short-subunit dehydrogenase
MSTEGGKSAAEPEPGVVLITGASSGIGEATALLLHQHGHVVYAGARRTDRMAALAEQGISTHALDVTDDDSTAAMIKTIIDEQGRIDTLINNAGYGSYGSVEDVPISEGRSQFEVNLFGLARLTQLAIPHMREAGEGKIINIASMGGHFGEALGAWYHASKFAVEGFSDSLRLELREFGIDVILIEPGSIKTEWGGIATDSAEKYSGHTAYAGLVKSMQRLYAFADRFGAEPSVVAAAILEAVQARRPRARYAMPFTAKAIIAANTLLPDRMLDFGARTLSRGLRR